MKASTQFGGVNRRRFVAGATSLAGGLAYLGARPSFADSKPIEGVTLSPPLPDAATKGFHVWNVEPIDYVAEEYLMSGVAPILAPTSALDTPNSPPSSQAPFNYLQHTPNHEPRKVLGSAPYTTRLVIYRPRDMSKFKGVTIIEPIHPQADGYIYVFNLISRFYASKGIAVVTLQYPQSFEATIKADPQRYGSIEIKDWTQFWGTIGQLGTLIKSGSSPLGAKTNQLYLTGYSLMGMCTSTFANFHHNETRLADGKPIFDGYLPHCNEYYIQPLDVPVIRVNSQCDFNYFTNTTYNPFARVPDSDDSWNRTRRYEVAGTQHDPLPEAEEGAAIPPFPAVVSCYKTYPAGGKLNDNVFIRPVFEIAVVHMEDWVTKGIAPPHAPWIVIGESKVQAELDENGNAVGGLRMPELQVPAATYVIGERECRLNGYMVEFSADKLRRLYGTKARYLELYDIAADKMVTDRWMLPDSAASLKQHARTIQDF